MEVAGGLHDLRPLFNHETKMTEDTIEIMDLLRELVESFTEHHNALKIEAKEYPGACYWMIKVHADEQPKVVGRRGTNIRALSVIIAAIGAAIGEKYTLRLLEPDPAIRRDHTPRKTVTSYDPARAIELLRWAVAAILNEDDDKVGIDCQEPVPFNYTLRITAPAQITPEVQEALRIIWTAAGQSDGVTFRLETKV